MNPKEGCSPESRFDRIDRIMLKISRYISYLVGAAILIIMLLALINVIVTKLFKFSVPSSTEWITYLNILAVFPAVAFVQLDRGHTRVDLFDNRFPAAVKKLVEVFSDILGMGLCGLISWRAFVLFQDQLRKMTMSSSSALTKGAFPLWPFSLLLSFFCVLWLLAFAWSVVRVIVRDMCNKSRETETKEGGDPI